VRRTTIGASPGVVVFVSIAVVAGLYAFLCYIREERIARAAVKRARDAHPAVWQQLGWVYRRIMNPTITIRMLRDRYGVTDPDFDAQLERVRRLARHKLIAVGVGFLCVAIVLAGTELWGWVWD
jgi:hypothetical protein